MESTPSKVVPLRWGTRVIYELQPGDRWHIFKGFLVIANPDSAPLLINIQTGERIELDASGIHEASPG